jgi:hypothetical protein
MVRTLQEALTKAEDRAHEAEARRDAALAALSQIEARLGELESLNRKHDTETTSIHDDMLALARLVGVRYDGVSSPAGFLHGDIWPAVVMLKAQLRNCRGMSVLETETWLERAEKAEARLGEAGKQHAMLVALSEQLNEDNNANRAKLAQAEAALRDIGGWKPEHGHATVRELRAIARNYFEEDGSK